MEFSFLTGWEAVLVPMLMVGADGGTHATSGVVPELTRQMYNLARSGQFEEAMKLQYRLLELFDAMLYSADFPEGFSLYVNGKLAFTRQQLAHVIFDPATNSVREVLGPSPATANQ